MENPLSQVDFFQLFVIFFLLVCDFVLYDMGIATKRCNSIGEFLMTKKNRIIQKALLESVRATILLDKENCQLFEIFESDGLREPRTSDIFYMLCFFEKLAGSTPENSVVVWIFDECFIDNLIFYEFSVLINDLQSDPRDLRSLGIEATNLLFSEDNCVMFHEHDDPFQYLMPAISHCIAHAKDLTQELPDVEE